MIVSEDNLEEVLKTLQKGHQFGIDTETTGLRSFHGDRIFSLILAADIENQRCPYYFNFYPYDNVPRRFVLAKNRVLRLLQNSLFGDAEKMWFAHNAKFDIHMLAAEECSLIGPVHCTKSIGRVVYNEFNSYSLEDSLDRIGLEKDASIEKYIEDHKLYQYVTLDHKKQREKLKFYYLVPFEMIVPYGIKDACGTLDLGYHQLEEIARLDEKREPGIPALSNVYHNEVLLTKTVGKMEANGCRIDVEYCKEAIVFEQIAMETSQTEIEEASGVPFKNSAKCLAQVFRGCEENFTWGEPHKITGKRQPLFNEEALEKIDHPMVAPLLRYRAAKNRFGFYSGFLYHRDADDLVHPSFNPDVARHGRFSSSNPNFQNLKKPETEELAEEELYVRRAIIPREGNVFLMPDWRGMEYALLLDYICASVHREVELAKRVNSGMKIHKATVEIVQELGQQVSIDEAKQANFLTIYGGGDQALADLLRCPLSRAQAIKRAIYQACPESSKLRDKMMTAARTRGYVKNWLGRICWFPNPQFAYKGPNYIISGGCADVMKIAMNIIQHWLEETGKKTLMVCTIHDELVLDSPREEAREVSEFVVNVMENTYPAKFVPLTVDMEWSDKSLADKIKGYPA